MLEQLLASVIDGLLLGFIYGLAAMGLTLIFGVMEVINLAHGPIMALGMFGVYYLSMEMGLNPYLALILVAVLGMVLGLVIYGIAVHRILDAPELSSLLATFSVNMMIIGLGTAFFTTSPYNVEFSMGSLSLGPIILPWNRVASAIIAVAATALLYFFLYRTPPGKAIRAVSQNRDAAELMGIPSTTMLALSFGIGSMLATVAGGLVATLFSFTILSGATYELKSFVIVVLGGLGNPAGALVGGLILGVMEGVIPVFIETSWVPVIEMVLFVLILLVKPQGLLGAK